MQDRFLFRLFWLTLAAALLIFVWRGFPGMDGTISQPDTQPRVVAARGDLASDEKATIE